MARMGSKPERPMRAPRQFTNEFKAGAVRLVLDDGKTVAQVTRDLDLLRGGGRAGPRRASPERAEELSA